MKREITIYKDRTGNWRWRMKSGGKTVGKSSVGFVTRKIANTNLYNVTGIMLNLSRGMNGTFVARFDSLLQRSFVSHDAQHASL